MNLVITGTEVHPFGRLIAEVDRIAASGTLAAPFFVQLGHNKQEPKHCEWKNFIGFGEMCALIESSRSIVTHAGAGSTLLCIQCGKRPIIVPRQKKFGEHVDDHQVVFARRLREFDLVDLVEDMAELETALRDQQQDAAGRKLPVPRKLVGYLENLLAEWSPEAVKRSGRVTET